jgi:Double-GTPase 2
VPVAEFVLWLVAVVAVCLCLTRTLWEFLTLVLRVTAGSLGPWQAGAADPRLPRVGPTGPAAHRAHWSRQMWLDAGHAAGAGLRAVRDRLLDRWLRDTALRLVRGRARVNRAEPFSPLVPLRIAVAPGTAVGAVLGALLAILFDGAVLLVLGLLLGLVWLLNTVAGAALRAADRGWVLVRGIRTACPHPGCYRPVPLAVHRCPGCGAGHRELRPGRYGTLWQVCACGQRLGTTRFLGRTRLAVECPWCDRPLPEAAHRLPVVHVPFVGATSSGKTMLMVAAVAGLQSLAARGDLSVEYATAADRGDAGALNQQLTQADWAHATTGGQPRAFMLKVGHRRRHRLLYLYDPMGESLRDSGTVREQHYLAHADGVVLVADVLAEPVVRRGLGPDDAGRATAARPASQSPTETYQRLTGELSSLTGRRRRIAVAAVVSKRDVLDQLGSLPVPGVRIDDWLSGIGLGGLVRGLGHDFHSARYWAVSAYAATGTGALESEQRRAAEPLLWLLARSGLRTGVRTAEPPQRTRTTDQQKGPAWQR